MKTCSKCKLEKELLDFHKNKNSKDGFCEKCKKCKNDYSKKYRLDNIDYFKEYGKNYIKDEKYIEYHKNYNKEYFQNKLLYLLRNRVPTAFSHWKFRDDSLSSFLH